MDPEVIQQILKGVIPPVVLAVVVFGAWRRDRAKVDEVSLGAIAAPLAAWGIAAITWLIAFKGAFPPADSFGRLPLIFLGVATVGLVMSFRLPRGMAAGIQLLSTISLGYLVVPPATFDHPVPGMMLLLCGAALPLTLLNDEARAKEMPRAAAFGLTALLGGAALVLLIAFSSLKLSQAAGIGACIAMSVSILSLFGRPVPVHVLRWPLATCAMLTLFQGLAVTSTPHGWVYLYCVGWAPLMAAGAVRATASQPRWQGPAYVGSMVGAVVIALGIAFASMVSTES